MKYGDIKVIFRYGLGIDQPIVKPMFPIVYDLGSDPGELFNLMYEKLDMMWMFAPAFKALTDYKSSTVKYPNVKPGEDFSGYKVFRTSSTKARRRSGLGAAPYAG